MSGDVQQGFTLWFTGLSGSGKTAVALLVERELRARGMQVERLDGDIVRQSLTRDLGFTQEDRDENIRRVTFVAKLLSRNGVAVICSFISPYRKTRDWVRQEVANFVEVFTDCPLEVCVERDPKGMYKRALAGEIPNFTGISDPYEPPLNPEIVLHTDQEKPSESAARVVDWLQEQGYVPVREEEAGYNQEEAQEVEERLRALGYVD